MLGPLVEEFGFQVLVQILGLWRYRWYQEEPLLVKMWFGDEPSEGL